MKSNPWCRCVRRFDVTTQHCHFQSSSSSMIQLSCTNKLNNKTQCFKQVHDLGLGGGIHGSVWPHIVALYELQVASACLGHANHVCSNALPLNYAWALVLLLNLAVKNLRHWAQLSDSSVLLVSLPTAGDSTRNWPRQPSTQTLAALV